MSESGSAADPATASILVRIDGRRRWFPDLSELFAYRHLVVILGRRDITTKYRQTVLGSFWIFTGPLVSAGLFSFVFGRVADLPSQGVPYFVFSYAGLVAWNLFVGVLSGSSGSVTSNGALISKIYFPRLVIPLYSVVNSLVNLVISFVILIVILVISGVGFSAQFVLFPVWLCMGAALGMGLALTFTSASAWYRDVGYLTPLITQLLLFLSPVAYSIQAVPANLRDLYLLNPLSTIVEGARWSFLGTSYLPPAWAIAYSSALTLLTLIGGLVVFTRFEGGFADVL